jgi:hypothetical protein
MKNPRETENLLRRFYRQKKAAIRTSEQMDREIVDYALEAYVEARKKSFASRVPKQRRMILRSPAIRVGAAVLIVLVVLLIIILSGTDDQPKQVPGETTVAKTSQQDKPILPGPSTKSPPVQNEGFDFEDIDLMLAAGNVDGVVAMVSRADFRTKVAVANYLSKMNRLEALLALVKLNDGNRRNYPRNPFALAIEEFKGRIEMMAEESDGQVETFEPDDLSPDQAGPNVSSMPNDVIVLEPKVVKTTKWPPERRIADTLLSDTGPSPTLTEGVYGSGYYFDGVNDYVYVGDTPSLGVFESVTFEAWIYPTDSGSDEPVIAKEGPGGNQVYWFGVYESHFGLMLNNGPDGWSLEARDSGSVSNNQWQHIASAWDGGLWRNYMNGVQVDDGVWAGQIVNSSAPFTIGSNSDFDYTRFSGIIDEVRVWNYARTAENIVTDMNGVILTRQPGLVGYWSFDNDEGELVKDLGPYGNDGTLSNTRPQLTEGVSGKGYYFDGHGDYIEIGAIEGLGAEQTKMLWIYPEAWTFARGAYLIDEGVKQSSNNWIELYDFDGNGTWEIRAGFDASNYFDSDGLIIDAGHWYHIAVVSTSSGDIVIYINGVVDSNSSDLSATTIPKGILIGSDAETKKSCFTGVMDEVAIFNRALSGEEIKQIYQNGGMLRGTEEGLVGYWNFDNDESDVVKDISPNGNDGKLGGW